MTVGAAANREIPSIGTNLKLFGVYYELFPDFAWKRCHTGACARRRPNTPESNRRADPVTAVPRFDLLRVTGQRRDVCSTFGEGDDSPADLETLDCRDANSA